MSNVTRSPYSVVVANSFAMKNDLIRIYKEANNKIIYIVYPGTIWPEGTSQAKRELNNKFIFLSVGRLTIDKGALFLWEAFYHLLNEISVLAPKKKVELQIVGAGELDKTLHFLTEEFGLSSSITFYGKVEHKKVFDLMKNANVLVHPALTEPFGNVVVEALGTGLPIIASNFDGPKEILVNGKYGQLVPRANTWKLKEAMKKVVLNKNYYIELLDKASKSDVRTKYTISNQAKALVDIIKKERGL
jgi:glycosyltransferase involved in cell wall biosynthesis